MNPLTIWRDWWADLSTVERVVAILMTLAIILALIFTSPAEAAAGDGPNNQAVWIALIGAVSLSVIGPTVSGYFTNRSRRQDREEDRKDREAVANQAAEAARLLIERQDATAAKVAEAARLVKENNKAVAAATAETQEQLKVIHGLVNSSMTAAMQSEYGAVQRELAMMQEVIELKRAAGKNPSVDALAAIGATKDKIAELAAALADRLKQG